MTELKRVLIVDDEESVLFVLNGALARVNDRYHIESHRASTAEEALAKARDVHFDLLITDIRLPGIDGVELTKQIRVLQPEMGVVWITAYGCQKLLEDAAHLGVHKCLDKPLEIAEIRKAARAALDDGTQVAGHEE